jgi:antirestriction protein ArdC
MSTTISTRRPGKTLEEKKAQAEALHNSISEQVELLHNSVRWAAFLKFARSFHAYSLNNVLLILSQMPEATQVAGFRKWQSLGRQVRKGEKAIRILGYSTKKLTEQDENGEDIEKRLTRFPLLSVFDITQTDLIDGAQDANAITAVTAQLTGADEFGIIDTLTGYLVEEGWNVQLRPIVGSKNGYTDPEEMRVVLDADLSPEHRAKTLIHETAHILLGHTDDPPEYVEHRGLMETEAESVAYIVAGLAGFDTSAYSIAYITGWSNGDTNLIKSTAASVLRTAHQIAEILDPTTCGSDPDGAM